MNTPTQPDSGDKLDVSNPVAQKLDMSPTQSQDELDEILRPYHYESERWICPGGSGKPCECELQETITKLQAHIDKAVALARVDGATAKLKQALAIVEEKNDVEILNWFDTELVELQSQKAALVGEDKHA